MLLYAAADLIWATKIKATADALGIPARPVRTPEMLEARLAEGPVQAFLVDLDKGDDALSLIRLARVRELSAAKIVHQCPTQPMRILAWGPHVAKDLLQAGRDAGADEVLTRGAMDHNLEEILVRLSSR